MVTQVWSNFIEQPLNISNYVDSATVHCDGSLLNSDGLEPTNMYNGKSHWNDGNLETYIQSNLLRIRTRD